MGLAQYILRYGVVMGKALYAAAKAGIDLFKKSKPSDTDLLKKFKAQNDKALKDKKIADRADKIVEKKEKKLLKQDEKANKSIVKSAKKFSKDTKGQREGKKYNPDPRTDSMNYSDKAAGEFGKEMSGRSWTKKEALQASLSHNKALMNAPVAATALVGTTASLVHKKKSQKKGK
tara:strand:- start:882 stop:1406 length:525 start_codon:yes stop_codon:yes gene_type:complete